MVSTSRLAILIVAALALSACATNVVAEKASRFNLAMAAYDAGDFPTAYQIWAELAEEDDLAAMRNTAQLLRQGKGVAKDSTKAFKLYKEAAEKGLVTAMANVADMYFTGEGTAKDLEAAVGWYVRAATAGLSIAQMKLAELYEQGVGVERDPARARALLERAARNGYAPARAKLTAMGGGTISNTPIPNEGTAVVTRRMSPGDPMYVDAASAMSPDDHAAMNAGLDAYVAGDAAKAFAAWRGPAERGVAEGQLRLGLLYEKGEGTGQDMIEAYRWLKLASAQGNKRAAAEFKIVSGAMAPSERAMAESLVKTGSKELKNGQ